MAGVRTEIRLKPEVKEALNNLADFLDVPFGVVMTLAAAQYAGFVQPLLLEGAKKRDLVQRLRKEFLEICDEVEKQS